MTIDWLTLERNHTDFKEKLRALSYERKALTDDFEVSVKERKKVGIEYKTLKKQIRNLLLQIKNISNEVSVYRSAWLKKGGKESNFWLNVKANEAMLKFQALKESRKEYPMENMKVLKKEYLALNMVTIKSARLIKENKSMYRNTQRLMDDNSVMLIIESLSENPTIDVALFVEFKRVQLSIRKQKIFPTKVRKGYILQGRDWYLIDEDSRVDRQCTLLEERFIEASINKYNK